MTAQKDDQSGSGSGRNTYDDLVSHVPHVLLELHSETPGCKFDQGSRHCSLVQALSVEEKIGMGQRGSTYPPRQVQEPGLDEEREDLDRALRRLAVAQVDAEDAPVLPVRRAR